MIARNFNGRAAAFMPRARKCVRDGSPKGGDAFSGLCAQHDGPPAPLRAGTPETSPLSPIKSGWRIGAVLVTGFAPRLNRAMIPEAKRAQIMAALQSNPNNPNRKVVARQFGVSYDTVRDVARKLGIGPSGRSWTKFPADVRAKIVAALRANPNSAAVAREIGGISPATVRVMAKKANIPLAAENMEKAKRLSPEKRARIIEALQANPNASMVARQVGGISIRTVQKIAEKTKIERTAVKQRGTRLMCPASSLSD
jgi:transposase-like protein